MRHFSRFPLAGHLDLPGSQAISGISQGPSTGVHASLSQGGFYPRGLWVAWCLFASLPFDLRGAVLCLCGQGGVPTSRKRNVWSGRGPAHWPSLPCPSPLGAFGQQRTHLTQLLSPGVGVGSGRYLLPHHGRTVVPGARDPSTTAVRALDTTPPPPHTPAHSSSRRENFPSL